MDHVADGLVPCVELYWFTVSQARTWCRTTLRFTCCIIPVHPELQTVCATTILQQSVDGEPLIVGVMDFEKALTAMSPAYTHSEVT